MENDDGIRVAANKHDFLALLLEVAGRVAGCERLRGKRRLSCLALHCKIDRTTLLRALEREGLPHWETLDRLVSGTDVPLLRWLIALGAVTLEDAASVLDQEPPPPSLASEDRALLEALARLPPAARRAQLEFLRNVTPPHQGVAHNDAAGGA